MKRLKDLPAAIIANRCKRPLSDAEAERFATLLRSAPERPSS